VRETSSTITNPIFSTLLFGESDALLQADVRVFGDQMNQVSPGVNAYDPIGPVLDFNSKIKNLQMPALSLATTFISPSYIDRDKTQNATLMVPLAGEFNNCLDGRLHRCGVGQGSMFFPQGSGQLKGSGSHRNLAILQFDPLTLEKAARAMLGLPGHASMDLKLQNPRVVPLTVAGQPFSTILQHVGALIDLHQRNAKVLTQLGLQDMLYRHIAMMLRPEAFVAEASRPRSAADSVVLVAQLCDYMREHLEAGLTLTDLETFSGLSARSLQLAFKNHAGCSPMQWLTAQKLDKIREKLLTADASQSVTSLAVAYFPNLGDFARYYRRQFGELPSQTRAKRVH
jgi:AraC-like DNA-binding protein